MNLKAECCCPDCGNCLRNQTYDSRVPCCCTTCGHCFRLRDVDSHRWPPLSTTLGRVGDVVTGGTTANGNRLIF